VLIALQGFRGERPAADPRQLDAGEAQVAENAKLWKGIIQPWYQPSLELAAVNVGPLKSIFRYTDAGFWLHWATDVDVARAPIAGVDRIYWTGDGAPRMGNAEVIAGITTLTSAAPSAQNFILVNNALGFDAGDSITVELDSGTHTTTITTIQLSLNRINLNNALPGDSASGNAVTNNNKGYPHGSYLLGVPAPATALSVAVDATANEGTVEDITTGLDEISDVTSASVQTFEVDLTVDSGGQPILFHMEAFLTGTIASMQSKDIKLEIYRDPSGDNELIFELVETFTFQGPAGTGGAANPTTGLNWSTVDDKQRYRTTYTPDDGDETYRFVLTHRFNGATAQPNWVILLKLTASLGGGIGVQLNTADHGLQEGDFVQLGGIKGTGTLGDLNKGRWEILSVSGDTIYIDADVEGNFRRPGAPIYYSKPAGAYDTGGTWRQVWDEGDLESRVYVCTYVVTLDSHDMEGPPSPPSAVLLAGDNQHVTVTNFIDPTTLADGRPYSGIRIYRTLSGSDEAEFQFVSEVAIDATTFSDTLRGTELDENLPSQYTSSGSIIRWEPPPSDMQGIIELPNGSLAAFRGNELLLCEPRQPHAWPVAYRHTMHDQIVGLGAFGASILVGTKGRPVIAIGTDPIAVSEEHVEAIHPHESKRGTVDMGYAILYPSKTGLVMVAPGEASIVTSDLFNDNQWEALNPSSFVAAKYGTRYTWFFDNGTGQGGFNGSGQGGYILDPRNPRATLTRLNLYVTEVWSDPRTDDLYLVIVNESGNEEIRKWEGDKGAIPMRVTWRSKEFTSRFPTAMGVVKVDADNYPVRINVYGDGELYDAVDVHDSNVARLSMSRGEVRKIEVEVVTDTEVEAVYVATNMAEIVRYVSGVA
jgi:hypothetical protein